MIATPVIRRAATLVAALACLLVVAPSALGQVRLVQGTTSLRVNPDVAENLADAGINVSTVSPARIRGDRLVFPILAGRFDPETGNGTFTHRGGLRLRRGRVTVIVRNFRLSLGPQGGTAVEGGSSSADAAGTRQVLLALDGEDRVVTRSGAVTRVTGLRAILTAAGARRLNRALRRNVFRAETTLGEIEVRVQAAAAIVESGTASITLDPSTRRSMDQTGISVSTTAPATADGDTLSFPITPGARVGLNLSQAFGTVRVGGGVVLSRGGRSVRIERLAARLGRRDVLASVDGRGLSVLAFRLPGGPVPISGQTISAGGIPVLLTRAAAQHVERVLGVRGVPAGARVGTVSLTATIR